MTKSQLIAALKEIDSEYRFQDIGYGSFQGNDFIVNGEKVNPSLEDLQEMYELEVGPLLSAAKVEFGL